MATLSAHIECVKKQEYLDLPSIHEDRTIGTIYQREDGTPVKWNGKRSMLLCEHGKRRSRCNKCGGSEICQHNRRKTRCMVCGGSEICVHKRRKANCVMCGGSAMCVHKRRKTLCNECNGTSICTHGKRKSRCNICGGSELCVHNVQKTKCRECGGSEFCKHGKRVSRCVECGGSETCNNDWCGARRQTKYQGFCYVCFVSNPAFKDHEIVRNYKNKERAVADFVNNMDETKDLTWVHDKIIEGGCSKRRPDLLVDMGSHVVIVEVDEQQHADYDTTCDQVRNMNLWEDLQCRPIVFIRFNPDKYTKQDNTVPSCWTLNKKGLCVLKTSMKKEWTTRLLGLQESIIYWTKNVPSEMLTIRYLFYNEL